MEKFKEFNLSIRSKLLLLNISNVIPLTGRQLQTVENQSQLSFINDTLNSLHAVSFSVFQAFF